MFFLDEIQKNSISKKKILLPLNDEDKKKNSVVYLLTPNYQSSKNVLNHPLIHHKYYFSYYMERSILYYVDSNNEITTMEAAASLLNCESYHKIIFNGLDKDVDVLEKIITPSILETLSRKYDVKIDKDLNIFIENNKKRQYSTDSEIHILSKRSYDCGAFMEYDTYIYTYLHILFLLNLNPQMDNRLLLATSLYESGLYEKYKTSSQFPFDIRLKKFCGFIETYISNRGEDVFIENVLRKNNSVEMLTKNFQDVINTNIKSCLIGNNKLSLTRENVEYETDLAYKYHINGTVPLDESSFMVLESANDDIIKKTLYKDRIKTGKDMLNKYKQVKEDLPFIKYTYLDIDQYKNMNLINDLYFYSETFLRNSNLPLLRKHQVYSDLMNRLINDKRFDSYNKKTVIIPIDDWLNFIKPKDDALWLISEGVNPIFCLYRNMINNAKYITDNFKDIDFVFLGSKSFFVIDFSLIEDINKTKQLFIRNIKLLLNGFEPKEEDGRESSPKAITTDIIDMVEKSQKIKIDKIKTNAIAKSDIKDIAKATKAAKDAIEVPKETGNKKEDKEKMKEELIDHINKAAEKSDNVDDALDTMDDDERLKEILSALATEPDNGPNISAARTSRLLKLQDDFMDKEFKGQKMKDILTYDVTEEARELPPISLKVDSVNPEWSELRYPSANDIYDLDKDIVAIFNSFHDKQHPLVIKEISAEDTSTSEDAVETYTVVYENEQGKRFTIIVDIPKFVDGKYMLLRGNRKNIASQLFPIPIMKTNFDEVQIATCYNKIFVSRFGTTTGKSNVVTDRIIKTISKNTFKDLKVVEGDNSRVCSKYEVPIDYLDFSSIYTSIETKNEVFMFNQDEIMKKFKNKIDYSKGFIFGYDKRTNEPLYFSLYKNEPICLSNVILGYLYGIEGWSDAYEKTNMSVRYTYTHAKIMGSFIPLIVICAYAEGLEKTLKKAGIRYELSEKRPKYDKNFEDIIKWKDGYLMYKLDYSSSLLMNGLKVCNTEDFSLTEINLKTTYLNFLDLFGGRIKADGLDNFYNLLIDKPITYNSLLYYKLPTDYVSLLLHANYLLTDNKFIKHSDISSSRRIRHNELIADLLYREVLAKAYGEYCTSIKHRGQGVFSVKRNALINAVLLNNTTDDQSVINALSEYESYNTITSKGPGGLNAERAYSLDKRSYDDSMINVLSMSTGFAGNVGIPRQATIDANIDGYRGYINNNADDFNEINVTKTLCMTEALTPYGITRDDPFRSAMNFVQTSKHGMRCRKSDPLLITTGADEALPYLISNTFAFKAKEDGNIIEKDDTHMIIEYKDGTHDYVNLEENVEKNSSSGFFVTLKLDSDLKVGSKVKKGEVVAYDKSSFSDEIGYNDNIAYNVGTLCKFAILNTDEGYEDSAIISKDLSASMTADIVIKKDIVLSKGTNVYNLVKKGQNIKEGDPLLIIQSDYDEDDTNMLLKNLVDDENEITNLGRRAIKSKVTGIVQDIVITRTVEIDELSETLQKVVKTYEKDIKQKKKIMKDYGITDTTNLPSTEKLPATGKLKNCEEGVLIEFYLKYEDKMSVGVA